jgi:hypothetical protein
MKPRRLHRNVKESLWRGSFDEVRRELALSAIRDQDDQSPNAHSEPTSPGFERELSRRIASMCSTVTLIRPPRAERPQWTPRSRAAAGTAGIKVRKMFVRHC